MKKYWTEKEDKELHDYFSNGIMTNNLYKKLSKIIKVIRTKYYGTDDNLYDTDILIKVLDYTKLKYKSDKGSIFNYLSYQIRNELRFIFHRSVKRKKYQNTIISTIEEYINIFENYDLYFERNNEYDELTITIRYVKDHFDKLSDTTESKDLKFLKEISNLLNTYINGGYYGDTTFGYFLYKNMKVSKLVLREKLKNLNLNNSIKVNNEDKKAYEKILE